MNKLARKKALYRLRLKTVAVEYKGGKCERCGYDKCLRALSFHHRNREDKKFALSRTQKTNLASVKTELDKCDLLCSNCHMEEEELRSGRVEANRTPLSRETIVGSNPIHSAIFSPVD